MSGSKRSEEKIRSPVHSGNCNNFQLFSSLKFFVSSPKNSSSLFIIWSPECGQPLHLSTASYQPSMQQCHLLRMPLKSVNVGSFRDGHVWTPKGLISWYIALDGVPLVEVYERRFFADYCISMVLVFLSRDDHVWTCLTSSQRIQDLCLTPG